MIPKFRFKAKRAIIYGVFVGEIIWFFLGPLVIQTIWNWKCVDLFSAPHLAYWDVFWLLFIIRSVQLSKPFRLGDYEILPVEEEKGAVKRNHDRHGAPDPEIPR